MLEYPVVTPENVRFHHVLAGPAARMVALAIDLLLLGLALVTLALVLSAGQSVFGDYADAVYGLSSFVLGLGYWIGLELRWNGQTPGKRALGLRVVAENGLRLEPAQVILRNVLRFVDLVPGCFGLGGAVALLHPEHRRLGDLVAGTIVIRERRVPPPERLLDAVDEAARRDGPRRIPTLRLPAAERDLLQELVLRRDTLAPAVRLRLFQAVSARYRQLLGVESAAGQSDERFVLEVAAAALGR